ncbi:hypothetical protein PAMC26510_22200 [Caballeronia sordidicola]|uniref:Uncharacterized protein n=1 Tax=Caballeronia sordidicola TaxID=196367 RepID=A0A242MLF9_CABSO|nr:hypothetical protein PAMC26510_22200 [Caballeronia sordidicola]
MQILGANLIQVYMEMIECRKDVAFHMAAARLNRANKWRALLPHEGSIVLGP